MNAKQAKKLRKALRDSGVAINDGSQQKEETVKVPTKLGGFRLERRVTGQVTAGEGRKLYQQAKRTYSLLGK